MSEPGAGTKEQSQLRVKAADMGTASEAEQTFDISAITGETLLAAYIARISTPRYTAQANAYLLLEAKQYVGDMCILADVNRRADRNAEMVLESHVSDAAAGLRNKREDPWKVVADWCKWVGFFVLGLTFNEWLAISHQKHILKGSVSLFGIGVALSAVLLVAGFKIDKPLQFIQRRLRRRSES